MSVREISAAEFESEVLQAPGWVIVDFFATWCPPCRALAPLLDRFADQNAETVKVVKVNTDSEEDLSAHYGVRTIPTLVAFKAGEEVRRAINPQSRGSLEALIA